MAWQIQKYIGGAEFFRTFGAQTRVGDGYGRAQGNWRDEYEPFLMNRAYKEMPFETRYREEFLRPVECPTVILIGPGTFSACEDLLINLSEIPDRPLFIGEETGGSTGAPLVIYFPHGAYARICTLRPLFPYSGKPFVGRGIAPDIEVKATFEDYRTGKDAALERALAVFN